VNFAELLFSVAHARFAAWTPPLSAWASCLHRLLLADSSALAVSHMARAYAYDGRIYHCDAFHCLLRAPLRRKRTRLNRPHRTATFRNKTTHLQLLVLVRHHLPARLCRRCRGNTVTPASYGRDCSQDVAGRHRDWWRLLRRRTHASGQFWDRRLLRGRLRFWPLYRRYFSKCLNCRLCVPGELTLLGYIGDYRQPGWLAVLAGSSRCRIL